MGESVNTVLVHTCPGRQNLLKAAFKSAALVLVLVLVLGKSIILDSKYFAENPHTLPNPAPPKIEFETDNLVNERLPRPLCVPKINRLTSEFF